MQKTKAFTYMRRALAPFFLFLLPLVFFVRIFLGQTIFVGDFSGSDLINLHLPFREVLHDAIIGGKISLWEDSLALGFPAFAEGQTGSLYAPNLLLSLVTDPVLSLNLSIVAVFIISLLSSYWYFRLTGGSPAASIFGAISFAFSSFFIARIKHLNLINVASLFPLLLVFTELFFEKRKPKFAVFAGITLAFAVFAGHPQMAYYSFLVVCFYAVYRAFWDQKKTIRAKLKGYLLFLGVFAIIGLGISAVQVFPTLELASQGRRLHTNLALSEDFSYHPSNIISLISPYYFGNPANGIYKADIKTFGVFWENVTYFGAAPFFLGLLAIPFILSKKRGDSYSRFFLFLAIFSFLVMLGTRTPLIFILTKFVPLFSIFRFPVRFNLFLTFSLVFLAVKGFDFFLGRLRSSSRKPFSAALILLLILDLFIFTDAYIGYLPTKEIRKTPEIAKPLREDKSLFRIYSVTQYQKGPFIKGWKNPKAFIEAREGIPPNDNLLYQLDSFNDRGWFEGGLSVARRNDLESYILLGAYRNPDLIGKVLGMYNVKYLISQDASPTSDFKKVGEGKVIKFYENAKVLPRAFIVPEALVVENEEEFFKVVSDPEFDPEKSVILENFQDGNSKFSGDLESFKNRNKVESIEYGDREVDIKTSISDSGYLVLTDTFYPGWKVSIDGREVPILLANHVVRTVRVNPGDNDIRFYYEPESYKVGKVISLASLAALGVIIIARIKFRRV